MANYTTHEGDNKRNYELLKDVCGYLNNWADLVVIRHKDIRLLEKMSAYLKVPVINAMTDVNHPCEVLSDMYALSKIRKNFLRDHFLFVGERGNIGLAWKEASEVMGFSLEQCCLKSLPALLSRRRSFQRSYRIQFLCGI